VRDLRLLPKAHLHLHFTGSMRHTTLLDLAAQRHVQLPEALTGDWPPVLSAADERGWFRFQRLYDAARAVMSDEAAVRRLVREVAEDEAADGSRWLEIQIDPSGYAQWFGGLTPTIELALDAVAAASAATGVGIAVVVAANRTRHPLDARTLARLAAQYAGRGVVAFGLSNDERRGAAADFAAAFAIADRAGLPAVPHAGELLGPGSVREAVQHLGATRLGHGVRSVEEPGLTEELARLGVSLEVCPTSNVSLGVYPDAADVPLRRLLGDGVTVALGADDPLLFGNRLAAQYEVARAVHGLSDAELAELARMSFRASFAPSDVVSAALRDIDYWLASNG